MVRNRRAYEHSQSDRARIEELLRARDQTQPLLTTKHVLKLLDWPSSKRRSVQAHVAAIRKENSLRPAQCIAAPESAMKGSQTGITHGANMAEKTGIETVLEKLDSLHSRLDGVDARLDKLEGGTDGKKADTSQEWPDGIRDTAMANEAARHQMACDSAFQAWGLGQSPPHCFGESLRNYRIRLLTPLKVHSKAYRDADLSLIADPSSLDAAQRQVIDDAVTASTGPAAQHGPLRKIVRHTDHGTETTWIGSALEAWAPFSGGAAQFVKLVVPPKH